MMSDEQYHELRKPIIEALHELKLSYERAAEPLIKQLTRIEAMRPPRPIVLQGLDALAALDMLPDSTKSQPL